MSDVEELEDLDPDDLRRDLEKLETGLGELRIWDTVLRRIAGSADLCPSSPLATLLERVRLAFTGVFGSLDSLFVEVRRRMQWEWTLKNMRATKQESDRDVRMTLQALQDELNEEVKQSHEFESNLEKLKTSLTTTRDSTFRGERRSRPDLQYNMGKGRVEPLTRETLQREDNLYEERSDQESSGSDDDLEDEVPEVGEPRQGEGEDSDDEDFGPASREQRRAKRLAKKRAIQSLTQRNHVKIHSLTNGQRVSGEIVRNSHYYQFELDKDDIGVTVQVQQPAGDTNNYVEITLNRGSPPTRQKQAYGVTTQGQTVALLNLQTDMLQPGQWFLRVIGRGARTKEYTFELRVVSRLMDFSRTLIDTIDDLDTQIDWQGNVTEKMVILDELVTHLLPSAQALHKATHNTQERGVQATEPPALGPTLEEEDQEEGAYGGQELASILQFTPPDKNELKLLSRKALMSSIITIYEHKLMSDQSTDKAGRSRTSLLAFTATHFEKRMGGREKGELALHELMFACEKLNANEPRVTIFSRFLRLLTPSYTLADSAFFLKAYATLQRLDRQHSSQRGADVSEWEESMRTSLDVAQAAAQDLFRERSPAWLSAFSKRLEKKLVKRDKTGKRGSVVAIGGVGAGGSFVDGDEFLLMCLEASKVDRIKYVDNLTQMFRLGDINNDKSITFDEFVGIIRSVAVWFNDLEVYLMYREGALISGLDRVTIDAFIIIGFRYQFLTRPYGQMGLSKDISKRRLASGEPAGTLPVYVTADNCVPLPETAFDIMSQAAFLGMIKQRLTLLKLPVVPMLTTDPALITKVVHSPYKPLVISSSPSSPHCLHLPSLIPSLPQLCVYLYSALLFSDFSAPRTVTTNRMWVMTFPTPRACRAPHRHAPGCLRSPS
jgi:hypothetical protein